jgi:acyl carrier protein phosphodiesterase
VNYLAHLYLSDGTPESMVGSMLGDFVKGDDHNGYSPGIRQGILLHRQIDIFTDAHSIHRRSRGRLGAQHRHTKGVLVDIFYDHYLARNWDDYADSALEEFAATAYRALETHYPILPTRLKGILPHMIAHDWLRSYSDMENIGHALNGLSRRLTRRNELAQGLEELQQNYEELKNDFREFFPRLITFTEGLRHTD